MVILMQGPRTIEYWPKPGAQGQERRRPGRSLQAAPGGASWSIYIYIYIYIYIHTCTYTYAYAYTRIYIYIYI